MRQRDPSSAVAARAMSALLEATEKAPKDSGLHQQLTTET
jgi:hypothetical protein